MTMPQGQEQDIEAREAIHEAIHDVAVVGGGPAGMAAALGLALQGARVALAGPRASQRADRRTAALFSGSITLLRNLGVWDELAAASAPINGIRLVDDTGGVLRAPEVTFLAGEVGLDVFGYNVPNHALNAALEETCRRHPGITVVETDAVERLDIGAEHVTGRTADARRIQARLVAGADGRTSLCREAAGISTRRWSYEQSAIVCTFQHARPHGGISTELHRPNGPFTVVPMPGNAASLVWVERPAIADRLMKMSDEDFREAVEARLMGLLGAVNRITQRAIFPLSGLTAETFASNRVALIGEAAHVIPPIGAQGLNLGLRDAAMLVDCAVDALREGRDPGGPEVMTAYSAARRTDVGSRIHAVDLLNRSLISPLLPVQLARGLGLHLLSIVGPFRRLVLREGLQPSFALPRLMQSGAGGLVTAGGIPHTAA